MKQVIHKAFLMWNFDKEEKWLNEMAAKGLVLHSVGYCRYEFDECLPGEYNIRLELLKHKLTHPESQKYIRFIEETGAEHIAAYDKWVYFRKKKADGPFELFSDNESKIKQINMVLAIIAFCCLFNIYAAIYNFWVGIALQTPNVWFGLISLSIGLWLAYGFFKLNSKKLKLKKEQQIFE